MGKIPSGILGPVSGRIGGVVGGRWKNTSYLRSYVVPGYSGTDLQLSQRSRFGYIVAAAKPFVGRIFNAYYDKFLSRVSGFNRCISENIQESGEMAPVRNLIVTDGPLYPSSTLLCTDTNNDGTWNVNWSTELGVDGLATDVAIAWLRDPDDNEVIFSANAVRSSGAVTCGNSSWVAANHTTLDCGLFFSRVVNGLVSKISRNLVLEVLPL